MKRSAYLGTPLLCWNSGKLSFLVCFFIYTSIGVQLFKFHVGYGKGTDLPCAAGGCCPWDRDVVISLERAKQSLIKSIFLHIPTEPCSWLA